MPTENRSSNTEMVSVPRELAERIAQACMFTMFKEDYRAISEILAQPAEQPQGEPVAWQYRVSAGPATGWSLWNEGKGEQFKAHYTVETRPLFTHADPAEVERLRANAKELTVDLAEALKQQCADMRTIDALRAQLAELVSAVRSINYGPAHAVQVPGDDEPCYAQRKEWIDWLLGLCVAASAEPSEPVAEDKP